MPKFSSLSSAIAFQIQQSVPNTKMPDGSAANTYVGNLPLSTEYNIIQPASSFKWGTSIWGVDNITKNYSPNNN